MNTPLSDNAPWYHGITRYQWLVLVIASLGWVFDVFEGQIFVASMNEAMPTLLSEEEQQLPEPQRKGLVTKYNNYTFGAFLLGGALGGVVFGMLSDRVGRTRTMVYTILFYSIFTCVSASAQTWWQLAVLRFFVAMGVGGEWAVASALVAEVFPKRARAWSLGIFHASSVLGTMLAVAAGKFIVGNPSLQSVENPSLGWRLGFLVGALPSLLILWIRASLREPEEWKSSRAQAADDLGRRFGKLSELFSRQLARRTFVGVGLAAVGLATFWGVHIYGKDLLRSAATREFIPSMDTAHGNADPAAGVARELQAYEKNAEMLGMLLATLGGGLGLVAFGPISERIGRRGAFLLYHIGGLASALVLFLVLPEASSPVLMMALPIFGFLTLGMHAGYAIYFPELFPTHIRGTGGGFCYNMGRCLAAPCLFASGWIQSASKGSRLEVGANDAASILALLYLVGAFLLLFAPETCGKELPE